MAPAGVECAITWTYGPSRQARIEKSTNRTLADAAAGGRPACLVVFATTAPYFDFVGT